EMRLRWKVAGAATKQRLNVGVIRGPSVEPRSFRANAVDHLEGARHAPRVAGVDRGRERARELARIVVVEIGERVVAPRPELVGCLVVVERGDVAEEAELEAVRASGLEVARLVRQLDLLG